LALGVVAVQPVGTVAAVECAFNQAMGQERGKPSLAIDPPIAMVVTAFIAGMAIIIDKISARQKLRIPPLETRT
jgi:hypothetical protein